MRDRVLAPVALADAITCCGVTALIAGLVSGSALATTGRLTAVSVAGLGVIVAIAWWLDRRRHPHARTCDIDNRSAHLEESLR